MTKVRRRKNEREILEGQKIHIKKIWNFPKFLGWTRDNVWNFVFALLTSKYLEDFYKKKLKCIDILNTTWFIKNFKKIQWNKKKLLKAF